jgi:predicted Zn-dependent protease
LIDESRFDEKDWISAAELTGQPNRGEQTLALLQKALTRFPGSSYLHFLLGKGFLAEKRKDEAKKELQQALELDPSNQEAADLLFKLRD